MVKQIIRYEKLINALGRRSIPRLYLLDGDRNAGDAGRMNLGDNAQAQLLCKVELENYLLQPSAIARALAAEASTYDVKVEPDEAAIAAHIDELQNEMVLKGSEILAAVYRKFEMSYSKVHSGQLIAKYITGDWGPIGELRAELAHFIESDQ